MKKIFKKNIARQRRHNRSRTKISGNESRPRLSVFRSARHVYAQIIDDTKGKTLVSASTLKLSAGSKSKKAEKAMLLGEAIAKAGKAKGITKVAFDRGGYKYHGRIKAVAEGARKGGLDF